MDIIIIMASLVSISDKVKVSFNNALESWNKGLIVNYTIFCAEPGNVTYEWNIEKIASQEEVCLLSYLLPYLDMEKQIHQTVKVVKELI